MAARSRCGATSAASVDALRGWSADDATSYVEFDRRVRSLARFLADLGDEAPPEIRTPGFGDALLGLRLGRAFRGLGKDDGRTILRVLAEAVADFVAESFETPAIRATARLARRPLHGDGPVVGGDDRGAARGLGRQRRRGGGRDRLRPGGPSALAEALRRGGSGRRARRSGPARGSRRILAVDGVATGVVLEGGEEIEAPAIVSGIDPKRLLTGLVDPVTLGPSLRWRAGNIRTPGTVAKVNLVLDGAARVSRPRPATRGCCAAGSRSGRRRSTTSSARSTRRSTAGSRTARCSRRRSRRSSTRRWSPGPPDGTQVMSVLMQWMPPKLGAAGDWAAGRDEVGDLAIRTLETVAPGLGARVTARQVLTPADLEADYGLTGGHPLHAEPALDSFFLWRPLLGWARYRMPVEGLYLAGSGAHPGGGVTGVPGRNAAREVIADREAPPQ